jgi:hypothetical protein
MEEISYLEAWFESVPRPLPDPVPFRPGETIKGTEEFLKKHFAFVRANVNKPTLYDPAILRLKHFKEYLIKKGHSAEEKSPE